MYFPNGTPIGYDRGAPLLFPFLAGALVATPFAFIAGKKEDPRTQYVGYTYPQVYPVQNYVYYPPMYPPVYYYPTGQ